MKAGSSCHLNHKVMTKRFGQRRVLLVGLTMFILFSGLLLGSSPAAAARWPLVIFGSSAGTTQTPYTGWDEILRHGTYTSFVDPDGNPDHDGIVAVAATPNERTAYFGVRGTVPINFQRGQKIVTTFYNNSSEEIYLSCRLSFTDPDSPNPEEPAQTWLTMYSSDPAHDNSAHNPVPAGTTAEMEYYITTASMTGSDTAPATAGDHSLVNLNLPLDPASFPLEDIVLTRIDLSDETDLTAPSTPTNLSAGLTALTAGIGPNAVRLTFGPSTDAGTNATGLRAYYIYRNGQLYDFISAELAQLMGTGIYFHDIFVLPGDTYQYTVSAVDRAQYGRYPVAGHTDRRRGNEGARTGPVTVTIPAWKGSGLIDPHGQISYQGAFRLPDDDGLGESWAYAHRDLTFYPQGNPGYNPETELPGSLYGYGHNLRDQIAEISIPIPVRSTNPAELPRAGTLQALVNIFPNIYSGSSTPPGGSDQKSLGLAYHSGGNGVGPRLYYTISNYYGTDTSALVMGAFDLDLTTATAGWHVGGLPPANVNTGLIAMVALTVPSGWANAYTGGRSLIVGCGYLSGIGLPSAGPSLYAVAPWSGGNLPANGGYTDAVELLKYGEDLTLNQGVNFSWGEYVDGGVWMSAGSRSAIVLSYRHNFGDWWYGFTSGTHNTEYDIPEPDFGSHGIAVTQWKTGLLFYNPDDLARVAQGTMESYEPLPYAGFDLAQYSLVDGGESGGLAFDEANGYLYFIDYNGDPGYEFGYSLIHVFKVTRGAGTSNPAVHSLLLE